jgi:hypothetical protein
MSPCAAQVPLRPAPVGIDSPDLDAAESAIRIEDRLLKDQLPSIGCPAGKRVPVGVVRDAMLVASIGVHHVQLVPAVAKARERDLCPVR